MDTKKAVPGVLWIALVSLGAIAFIQCIIGLKGNWVVLVNAVVVVVLLIGLHEASKAAYVVTLVLCVLGVIVALAKGPGQAFGVLIGNGLVAVPVFLCREYFFFAAASNSEPGQDRV